MIKIKLVIIILLLSTISFSQIDINDQTGSSNLIGASMISVTIGGDFAVTGTYPASMTERVDQFITRMYEQAKQQALRTISDPQFIDEIKNRLENYSLRDITLKRSNGNIQKIDLLKFRVTGDFENNPYLKNDDVLIFAPADFEHDFYTIDGAIMKPGKYPYVEGDDLSDAITLAQGINEAYENIRGVEINRLNEADGKFEVLNLSVNDNVPIKRGDRIRIIAYESDRKAYSVQVIGEVNIPGSIPITKNNTTLREVIEKAGGFKETAGLNRARLFTGKAIKLLLEKQFNIEVTNEMLETESQLNNLLVKMENFEMTRMSNLTLEDTAYFYVENQIRVFNEGSNIDFENIMNDTSESGNYIVSNDDIIIIPEKLNSVYVFGQVPKIGYVPFKEGVDYKYYINEAGGLGEYADDEIMIIKAKTRHWISTEEEENIKIEEGDYIWIPKDPVHSFNFYVQRFGAYLGIVSSVATILLLLIQFTK